MQAKRTITTLITLVILGVAIFFLKKINSSDTGQPVEPTQTIASTSTTPYEIKSFTYASSSKRLPIKVTIEYVQFPRLYAMNDILQKEAREIFNESVKELVGLSSEHNQSDDFMVGQEFVENRTIDNNLVFINRDKNIISIGYKNYVDTGGAHGTFFFSSDTFDIANNKKLTLSDLLKNGYEKDLVPYMKDKIAKRSENCVRCDMLEDPDWTVENFIPESFVLYQDGIRFLYGTYELGPYSFTYSGQELIIPKTDISAHIAREW